MDRFLTKSRFKLALECPTKLFYTGKKGIYADLKLEDEFLKALAEGGYQVGELAKLYYPGGFDIVELGYEESLATTRELLKQKDVIIYEAAFKYNNLFLRSDILVKVGNQIDLIEVKAKSINPSENSFTNQGGFIVPKWKPYLFDIAFQKYVIEKSCPQFKVTPYLLLADKTKMASVDGLNQKLFIYQENGRIKIKVNGATSQSSLGTKILVPISVEREVRLIHENKDSAVVGFDNFENRVCYYADSYASDTKVNDGLTSKCAKCEFQSGSNNNGLKSGFKECWSEYAGFKDIDFQKPSILKLWDFRKKDEYIKSGKYFLADLSREDIEGKTKSKKVSDGLSRIDRQELQINSAKSTAARYYFDSEGFKNEMASWKFPLHFIDFETTAVAIPFNSGRRPYEQMAFQFSHHSIQLNGSITHSGQWINVDRGRFPNFDFVRALKIELQKDEGTIFRYAPHENTILNAIYGQLLESNEPDKDDLCNWIKTITKSTSGSTEQWLGHRNMVDMRDLVLKYYFSPVTNGSNSIKDILPAMLNDSDYLRDRYSKPIYGDEILSENFSNHTWITFTENGRAINPYELLPTIHEGYSNDSFDDFLSDEDAEISDGGAAMMAYAKMQFAEISDIERQRIIQALLRYCELDTFAMVMIYEGWKSWSQ